MSKGEIARNFFFCHYVFKKPSAAEASESVYMRERVNIVCSFSAESANNAMSSAYSRSDSFLTPISTPRSRSFISVTRSLANIEKIVGEIQF